VINPYDQRVANKKIEGEQMTIWFHVDDCKLIYRKTNVMDSMIDYLQQEYESIFEDGSGATMVSRGKTHKYLGMTLDYTVHGQVKIVRLSLPSTRHNQRVAAQSQVRHPIAFSN
jgi:hypothetical protein